MFERLSAFVKWKTKDGLPDHRAAPALEDTSRSSGMQIRQRAGETSPVRYHPHYETDN
jgi:hypothetical protein